MTTAAIEAEGLVKTFGEVRALDGIDMVASEGSVFGLLGPNGAGKTTAIRVLSTLLRPDAGRASVGGFDVVRQPKEVRRLIGLTGQYAAVDELLSGQENLYMIGRLLGLGTSDARATGGRAAGGLRPLRCGGQAREDLLGRDAPAPGPRRESGGPAALPLPGRADDGAGSAEPPPALGHHPQLGRRGRHRPADHPVPGRGRSARRRDRRDRPRPRHRRRHATGAQEPGSAVRSSRRGRWIPRTWRRRPTSCRGSPTGTYRPTPTGRW